MVILASQSLPRKDLLTKMGVKFDIVPSGFDENLDDTRPPEEVAIELALGKSLEVARRYPGSVVIGSDTIVTIEGKQLGKAKDSAEAQQMLRLLAGKMHTITTGVAVVRQSDGLQLTGADTVEVYFKPYDETAVSKYLATGDFTNRAAGYGIQSGAAPLIECITGNYDAVVGLPTKLLATLLAQIGIKAKAVTLTPPVKQKNKQHKATKHR